MLFRMLRGIFKLMKNLVWVKNCKGTVIEVYLDNDPNPHFITQKDIILLAALKESFS